MREKVLNAALELLADQGVRKLTQPRVAERAGVRQSHVTYYFPRRADLIGAVARRYIDSAALELMQLFMRGESEDLGQLLIAFAYQQVTDRRRARTLMGLMVASDEDEALREQMIEAVGNLRNVMARAMGVEPGDPAATVMQATLWGLGINSLLMNDEGDDDEMKALVDHVAVKAGLNPKPRKSARRRKGSKPR